MRFTPTGSCKVKGARVYFKLNGVVDDAKVGLYENKDGLPGWEKNYEKFTPQEGWNDITFSPAITFDTDFWIAVHLTWSGEGLFITADGSLNYPNKNAWDQSGWHTNPGDLGGDMLIRAIVSTVSSITVTDPDGLESWERGTPHNITWTSDGVSGNVDIELWKGGIKDSDIVTNTANNGSYNWAILASQTPRTDYRVRITSIDSSSIWDESNNNFSITEASGILVIEPNGGKYWTRDNSYDITWTSGTPESIWDTVTYAISSPHPYPDSYDTTWIISDFGAEKMKVHFNDFNTSSGDYVYLYDKADNQIISYNGNLGAFWSQEVPGDTVKLRLVSNFMWNAYGFDIDKYVAFHAGEDYNVKIELYKGVSKDIDIATVPVNPALYSWAIPASQTPGTDYKMRIIRVDNPSVWDESDSCFSIIDVGTEEEVISLPKDYRLSQVYPNPAIRKTVISYQLPAKSEVSLRIYDAVGGLVKVLANNEEKESGYHNVRWNAEGLASGIYFVKFIAGNYKVTKKLVLLR